MRYAASVKVFSEIYYPSREEIRKHMRFSLLCAKLPHDLRSMINLKINFSLSLSISNKQIVMYLLMNVVYIIIILGKISDRK